MFKLVFGPLMDNYHPGNHIRPVFASCQFSSLVIFSGTKDPPPPYPPKSSNDFESFKLLIHSLQFLDWTTLV